MGLGSHSGIYRAHFDENTAATYEIVAAVAGKRIVVINLVCVIGSRPNRVRLSSSLSPQPYRSPAI